MIVTENLTINGVEFVKTYSDSGFMVERDGVRYGEAIDPAEFGRTYTETDGPIEVEDTTPDPDEATEQDYLNALNELGVQTDEESNS